MKITAARWTAVQDWIMAKESMSVAITIEATFGSEIQRDVSLRVLREFLEAWAINVQQAHKKNSVAVSGFDT